MKYYVANPNAPGGIAELDEDQATLKKGNRLEYSLPNSTQKYVVDSLLWSKRRKDVVRPAYGLLVRAEKQLSSRLDEIRQTKKQLVRENRELSQYENKPLFKETNC